MGADDRNFSLVRGPVIQGVAEIRKNVLPAGIPRRLDSSSNSIQRNAMNRTRLRLVFCLAVLGAAVGLGCSHAELGFRPGHCRGGGPGGHAEDGGAQRGARPVARVLQRGEGARPVGGPDRGRGWRRARRWGRTAVRHRCRTTRGRMTRAAETKRQPGPAVLPALLSVRPRRWRRRDAGARSRAWRRLRLHHRHQR